MVSFRNKNLEFIYINSSIRLLSKFKIPCWRWTSFFKMTVPVQAYMPGKSRWPAPFQLTSVFTCSDSGNLTVGLGRGAATSPKPACPQVQTRWRWLRCWCWWPWCWPSRAVVRDLSLGAPDSPRARAARNSSSFSRTAIAASSSQPTPTWVLPPSGLWQRYSNKTFWLMAGTSALKIQPNAYDRARCTFEYSVLISSKFALNFRTCSNSLPCEIYTSVRYPCHSSIIHQVTTVPNKWYIWVRTVSRLGLAQCSPSKADKVFPVFTLPFVCIYYPSSEPSDPCRRPLRACWLGLAAPAVLDPAQELKPCSPAAAHRPALPPASRPSRASETSSGSEAIAHRVLYIHHHLKLLSCRAEESPWRGVFRDSCRKDCLSYECYDRRCAAQQVRHESWAGAVRIAIPCRSLNRRDVLWW